MAQPQQKEVSFFHSIIYSGLSGAIATTCIYPIDLTKTKLQDQKAVGAAKIYKGPVHAAQTIFKNEGIRGMYRGWPPNVLLVMPEKAIKLTMNDVFRSHLKRPDGTIGFGNQMLAGGLAGLCQVIMTNPMELLKIQGATMVDKFKKGQIKEMVGYTTLTRNLGVTGLYTGVIATLLRDIPFSMLYFSLYSTTKDALVGNHATSNSSTNNLGLRAFAAGAIAGTAAAAVTTPLDVIKTRVHSNAVPQNFTGSAATVLSKFASSELGQIRHHTTEILRKEGLPSFFKGIVPRCFIISPLFAITMSCFEKFKEVFG